MVLVLVTTKSDAELFKLAPIVAKNIAQGGFDWNGGICFVRSETFPIVINEDKMVQTSTTMIFIFGVTIENQSESLRLAEKITSETGCKTTIL